MRITNDSMTVITYCEDDGQWRSLAARATLNTSATKVELHVMEAPCILEIEQDGSGGKVHIKKRLTEER